MASSILWVVILTGFATVLLTGLYQQSKRSSDDRMYR